MLTGSPNEDIGTFPEIVTPRCEACGMSLLMFRVVPDAGATILTDTLVTDRVGVPSQFTAKCRVIPQMRMAMAGTGSGNLLNAWYQQLNEGLLAVDIDMCARHASVPLSELWEEICSQHGLIPIAGAIDANETAATLAGRTATIYHFGPDVDGRFVGSPFARLQGSNRNGSTRLGSA